MCALCHTRDGPLIRATDGMGTSKLPPALPAWKQKVKTVNRINPTKQALSTELVGDSDDDSDDEERPTVAKTVLVAKRPVLTHTKTISPRTPRSSAKASKKKKALTPELPRDALIGNASESGGESEDEDESESGRSLSSREKSPLPTKPKEVATRPPQAKPPPKVSTAEKTMKKSTGKESIESVPMANGKVHMKGREDIQSSSDSSESGSESSSGSSDQTSLQSPRKRSPITRPVSEQTPQAYKPPAGFEPASVSFHPSSRISEMFAPSNLAGKHIWHITAPASVPLTSVKEVSTNNIANGASVLTYKGANYGLVSDSDAEQAGNRALLLPSIQSSDYKTSINPITKTLHLQQLMSLPSHAPSPSIPRPDPTNAPLSYKKTPRPQPQGLKMRYHPFGASDESEAQSESESLPAQHVAAAPQFRVSNPVSESSQRKKRKRSESASGEQNIGVAPANLKKKRQKASQESAGLDSDITMDDATQEDAPLDNASLSEINGTQDEKPPNGKESKEARKRRRKEKQRQEPPDGHPTIVSALPVDITKEAAMIMPEEVVETNLMMEHTAPPPRESTEDRKKKRKVDRQKQREV